jgi:CheY-like chemotaxis protein
MEGSTAETGDQVLLGKINDVLTALGVATRWRRAPKYLPEYAPLKGKSVLMVDDVMGVLENFIPDLVIATDGRASFLHHEQQTAEALASEIMSANPDIVLLDYNLAQGIKGDTVANLLKEQGFAGQMVGFSSENQHESKFVTAGAQGCVEKINFDPAESIKKLAEIV